MLSSDEDEIDESNQEYLERLQEKVTKSKKALNSPFNIATTIQVPNVFVVKAMSIQM